MGAAPVEVAAVEPAVPVSAVAEAEPQEMVEDDDVDAFDFFSPEPIGSAARELEKQQEALVAQEIVAAPVVEAAPEPMETEDSVEAIAPAIADAAAPISPVAASPAVSPEAKVLTPPAA